MDLPLSGLVSWFWHFTVYPIHIEWIFVWKYAVYKMFLEEIETEILKNIRIFTNNKYETCFLKILYYQL